MKALVLSEYKQLDLIDMDKPQPGDEICSFAFRLAASAEAMCMDTTEVRDGVCHQSLWDMKPLESLKPWRRGDPFSARRPSHVRLHRLLRELLLLSPRPGESVRRSRSHWGFYARIPAHGSICRVRTIPVRIAYSLPDNMPFEHAALIEAVSVAVHAISLTPIALDDTVVVVGAGMIGLLRCRPRCWRAPAGSCLRCG